MFGCCCVRLLKCLISECSIVSLGGTAAGLSEPLAHYSLFCGQVKTPILVTFGQICNFRDPTLVTFYLCIYLTLNEENFSFHIKFNIPVRLLTVNMKNCLKPAFLQRIHRIHKWRTRGKKLVPNHESEALEDKQKLQMKTFSELTECLAQIPPKKSESQVTTIL